MSHQPTVKEKKKIKKNKKYQQIPKQRHVLYKFKTKTEKDGEREGGPPTGAWPAGGPPLRQPYDFRVSL
jgi:hypothetical protein